MGLGGSRRQWMLGAGAALAGLAAPLRGAPRRAAPPASDPLAKLLGQGLPDELRAILPPDLFKAADFVTTLVELQGEARRLKLPPGKLSLGDRPIPDSVESLYEFGMPRLVALIDRFAPRNALLADKAGGLLAQLHRTQYALPAFFEGLRLPPAADKVRLLQSDPEVTIAQPEVQIPPETAPDLDMPRIDLPADLPPEPIVITRSLRYPDLSDEYAALFNRAEPRPEHKESTDWHLAMMRQSRARYEAVAKRNGVPWYFVAAIHGLEASFNFRGHLHNGDFPLTRRTRQVPAGRPLVWLPPSDWEDSAADALRLMGFAHASDWSLARTLYRLEAYNGFGYRRIGRASPYLWSFSTNYDRGKFVADGRFSATARSSQCGAAVMLKLLDSAGEIQLT